MVESRRRRWQGERDSDKLTTINRHALHPAVLNDNNNAAHLYSAARCKDNLSC